MIRVLVMPNNSLLADAIASILAEEIDLEVVRVTRRELAKGQPYAVVIIVDEGEAESETINVTDLFRDDITLLVIRLSLKSGNIFVYESYQLTNPRIERVIDLVRDFVKTNLKKKDEEEMNENVLQKMTMVPPFQVCGDSLAHDL